ncbi:ABC transporter substrate-binding protein [Lutibaculum baratangense]|uniref:Thiamine pyrimidine synthase n=1 Tax=Lutibaculum baratangense AMV1 TaxID=631454 RepID=V4QWQ3_9HYPH|nr:ABC transporter substrate-binding protein [Lutibaculum baratangense]ESR24197.1 Pyrimidine ABC transporter, substrate-binding component [Lutibaculum baratangense AMV1]
MPHRYALKLLGLALGLLVFFGLAPGHAETVRVQLLWHHQAQFAGIYVAQAKGFYEREGLDVETIEGMLGFNALQSVASGRADVALSWLPAAIDARRRGWNVVNIGQILRTGGTSIVCRRDAGIAEPRDVAGKRLGVWYIGDELSVQAWLESLGLSMGDVSIGVQSENGADLVSGEADCVTAMAYNEYWSILAAGLSPSELMVVRLADHGLGILEDGLYVLEEALADPERRDRLARFLKATAEGWAYAGRNVDEAMFITMAEAPGLDPVHQRRMLETILRMIGGPGETALMDIGDFETSVDIIAGRPDEAFVVRQAAVNAWTHRLRYESGLEGESLLTLSRATRHYLAETLNSGWFYALTVIGAVVFGFAGFMRAQQRNYDLWGAFVLTLLPAGGGGTIRDLLVGGDRYPPFIIQDPVHMYIVLATFLAGVASAAVIPERMISTRRFDRTMKFLDTLGFAAFCIVGAKVALMAGLTWIWIPICCALTCAGGGMLSDVIMGREPRTFQGEPYEEVAIMGGIFLLLALQVADAFEQQPGIATAAVVTTLVLVFCARGAVIVLGLRSHRFGQRRAVEA